MNDPLASLRKVDYSTWDWFSVTVLLLTENDQVGMIQQIVSGEPDPDRANFSVEDQCKIVAQQFSLDYIRSHPGAEVAGAVAQKLNERLHVRPKDGIEPINTMVLSA